MRALEIIQGLMGLSIPIQIGKERVMQMSNLESTKVRCNENGFYARIHRFKKGKKKSVRRKERINRHTTRKILEQ